MAMQCNLEAKVDGSERRVEVVTAERARAEGRAVRLPTTGGRWSRCKLRRGRYRGMAHGGGER